ncbi:MAG: cupin [bacterium (Candidatus Stahlbacteria) CG23_combo_of_CG06-09_8_20_14_all_34_7]|nr:MAG: cupin [bacterium (Candidatus Stahlbacteria) CG23_combo_of_CG06-09_8_20_14_all_34_7]
MDKSSDLFYFTKPTQSKHIADYQQDSIVSKTLIDKRNGTVTFFAFEENQGLTEHISSFDTIVIILDGEADIKINGKKHIVKEGEMIVMPASKPHSVKARVKFKMFLIMIKS